MFFLDLQTLRAEDEGWLVLDVTAASDHGLLNRSKDLGLRLYVETEDGKAGVRQRTFSRALIRGPGCTPALQLSDGDLGRLLTLRPSFVACGRRSQAFIHPPGVWGGASCVPGSGHRKPEGGPRILCDYIKGPQGWSRGVRERSEGEELREAGSGILSQGKPAKGWSF